MPLNYIRLLAGLRGGFQKGIAGWRRRLTRPTTTTNQTDRYPSLIIARNRFTVRERSKRRQQSAMSVYSSGELSAW